MAHQHMWKIAYNVPMGIPDHEGRVPKLLIRACKTCNYAEVLHGAENLQTQRNALFAWEAWADGRLVGRGDMLKWKHT